MKRRIVIFDLGKVLIDFVWFYDDPHFLSRCTKPQEEVKVFFEGEYWHKYECGAYSTHEFFVETVRVLGYTHNFAAFKEDLCRTFTLNQEFYDKIFLAVKVRKGVDIWILSNIGPVFYEYFMKRWPGIFYSAWRVYLSHELGFRKGQHDKELWAKILKDGDAKGKEIIFVDDLAKNGLYPRQIGVSFICHTGVSGTNAAIGEYLTNADRQ